jgi:HPt (histidine-containing phosphotransfer) domain-containing protein
MAEPHRTTDRTGINGSHEPIRSAFANDPDMREIVEMYVQEMPERISRLEDVWRGQHLDELKRLAHQIKGASGGYGFEPVGEAAGRLEHALVKLSEGSAQVTLEQMRGQFGELLDMCRRVQM